MTMIQFHILRNYASSNLNRDEIGAPKTAIFAGAQRGRISSQCLKRTWRNSPAFLSLDSSGIRTRFLPELVADRVKELADEKTYEFAMKYRHLFSDLGKSEKTKDKKKEQIADSEESNEVSTVQNNKPLETKQIMFFSKEDIDACAKAIIKAEAKLQLLKEEIKLLSKNATVRPITLDIALFGRMITDDKFADVDASLQVAHAISTNRVNQESDYFTAADDLASLFRVDSGAAHLGDCDYNSCCYYKYATLDVDQLKHNLKDSPDALARIPQLINALLEAMVYSSPTGKQNSFAAHSLPSVVCIEKKSKKIPVSLINAFEIPVTHNYSIESTKKLVEEIDKIDKRFDTGLQERIWLNINGDCKPQEAQKVDSLNEMKDIAALWIQ